MEFKNKHAVITGGANGTAFITGENITIDGGMSRLMVYHNDNGWKLE